MIDVGEDELLLPVDPFVEVDDSVRDDPAADERRKARPPLGVKGGRKSLELLRLGAIPLLFDDEDL